MPSICGYAWPKWLDDIIREEAERHDVPLDIAYTFIAAESSFDPTQVTPEAAGGYSYGLLQLYDHGQGAGYPTSELLDPRRNLQIGLPYIHNAILQSWRADIEPYEYIYLVATRSGHPGQVDRTDYRIRRIAQIWSCFGHGVGVFGPGGIPSTTAGPGPGVSLASSIGLLFLPVLFPGGIIRSLLPSLSVHQQLRTAALAVTPGGIVRNLQWALDPARLLTLPTERLGVRIRTRRPPRHRVPRGRPSALS